MSCISHSRRCISSTRLRRGDRCRSSWCGGSWFRGCWYSNSCHSTSRCSFGCLQCGSRSVRSSGSNTKLGSCVAAALLVLLLLQPCHGTRPTGCPGWLAEYENWHAANRGQPRARYLVAAPQLETRNGLGDRVRGILFAARIAASTQRVLLVTWDLPGEPDIAVFLQPAGRIDWTLPGVPVLRTSLLNSSRDAEVHTWGVGPRADYVRERAAVARGGYASPARVLVLRSNEHPNTTCEGCVPLDAPRDAACVFSALFKASGEVARRAQEQLGALYPGVQANALQSDGRGVLNAGSGGGGAGGDVALGGGYTAVHLRLGMPGERHFQDVRQHRSMDAEPLSMLVHSVSCGLALARSQGINASVVPLLLLTDNNELRSFAARGRLSSVVASGAPAVHLGHNSASRGGDDAVDASATLEAHYSVFVDLLLLAGARCLVLTPSGFSTTAWYLGGGTPCLLDVRDCIATCAREPNHPRCIP